MDLLRKLEILTDATKSDASCASGGTEMRDSSDGKGLGSTARAAAIRLADLSRLQVIRNKQLPFIV
jgi:predicted DNA-binding helix-hairpin-helix protein